MPFFERLEKYLSCFLRIFCPPVLYLISSEYQDKRWLKIILAFLTGFTLGQMYYLFLLRDIPLYDYGYFVILAISIILGISNAVLIQVRCILCLLLPIYCGKAGRGVLKAVVLSYVVAGPITNMGLNAKEVVRVFACSKELSFNLSKIRYHQLYRPVNKALVSFKTEVDEIKETISSIRKVIFPIEYEIEGVVYIDLMEPEIKFTDSLFNDSYHINSTGMLFSTFHDNESKRNEAKYVKKMYYRCENQLSHAISICFKVFSLVYDACKESVPRSAVMVCWPLMLPRVCDVRQRVGDLCYSQRQVDPGLGEGYTYLKKAGRVLTDNLNQINLQTRLTYIYNLHDIQDAKETGDRVLHAFNEKYIAIKTVIHIVNFCLALLFLRILIAAQTYHDLYLTSIDFDNIYITGYFKKIDRKREKNNGLYLLPLNKIQGTGILSNMMKKILNEFSSNITVQMISKDICLPHPRSMPAIYYVKIYAGYLWILLLLYINPYTLRIRRLICSYFYPEREKRRILHLYNDILKKRMKIQKTLRRKAVQAVRAHYLSGENLLSVRMRYPNLLGWLVVFPAARMKCLICEETQPRNDSRIKSRWQTCNNTLCPFVLCGECIADAGGCLACDPALALLSDVDSLSDEPPRRF